MTLIQFLHRKLFPLGKPPDKKSAVLFNIVKTGVVVVVGGGGVIPISKKYVVNFV